MMQLSRSVKLVAIVLLLLLVAIGARGDVADVQAQAASDPAQTISATGIGQVAVTGIQATALNIGLQQQVGALEDLPAALKQVTDKGAAIKSALQAVGIPASNIRVTNFTVSSSFGPVPLPGGSAPTLPPGDSGALPAPGFLPPPGGGGGGGYVPPTPGFLPTPGVPPTPPVPPMPTVMPPMPILGGYFISETIQADVSGTDQLLAAIPAAVKAGAGSVNTFNAPASQALPDAATLGPAVSQATQQADAMAKASAAALGRTSGDFEASRA